MTKHFGSACMPETACKLQMSALHKAGMLLVGSFVAMSACPEPLT